ncbi:hypothetical protein C8T65DRAFT_588771 [Cerioporus squamosus]|nr:hypothetical protein C8T65DRAFT_588771 [Cerioporus squamosus]
MRKLPHPPARRGDTPASSAVPSSGTSAGDHPIEVFHDDELRPCALQYADDGRAIIVSYVHHGIVCWDIEERKIRWRFSPGTPIARTAISPDGNAVVAYNLSGGFDYYKFGQSGLAQRYHVSQERDVFLPVCFIHQGDALVVGCARGEVTIIDREDGSPLQVLRHSGMTCTYHMLALADRKIQKADSYRLSYHLIATGSSERGKRTAVRLWITDTGTHLAVG